MFQVGWRWGGRGANTWLIVPARECAALWFADVSIAWRMEAPAPLYHVGGGGALGLDRERGKVPFTHTHTHLWTLSLDLNMTGAGRCVVDVWSWRCLPMSRRSDTLANGTLVSWTSFSNSIYPGKHGTCTGLLENDLVAVQVHCFFAAGCTGLSQSWGIPTKWLVFF